ncbi:hypothetical protein ABZP36_001096 [Zizania latifolia]
MGSEGHGQGGRMEREAEMSARAWKLRMDGDFRVLERFHHQPPFYSRFFTTGSHGVMPQPSLPTNSHCLHEHQEFDHTKEDGPSRSHTATAASSPSSAAAEVVGAGLGVREGGVGARKARNARMSVRPPIGMDPAVFLELVRSFVAKEERQKARRLAWLARRRARNAKKHARRADAAAAAAARVESAAATAPLRLPDEEGPPAAAAANHQDPHEAGETEPAPMEDGGVPIDVVVGAPSVCNADATRRASFGSSRYRL